MLENIRISFQGIWSHKLRSLLTMLGIIIGIAAIIAIVSTIKGENEQIKKNLIGSGTNSVTVRLTSDGDMDYEMEYTGIPDGIPVLDETTRKELEDIDHVEAASIYTIRNAVDYIYYNSTALSGERLIGADKYYIRASGYQVQSGRGFLDSDYSEYRKVCLIDSVVANNIFPNDDPIGKTLDIKEEPFIIIGVIKESAEFTPEINSVEEYYTYMGDDSSQSGLVIIPDVDWSMIIQYDEPQNIKLLADSTDNMSQVGSDAADFLNQDVTNKDKITYRAVDKTKTAQQNQQLTESTNQMLIWVASISLLVGGIGVMNIMLVSVTERTREIGLKKAIGARKNRIMAQFLTEAAVLTSMGGIVGTITGIIAAQVIAKLNQVPVGISIPSIIIAIVFSMLIGLVFGFLPARNAANLDPIVALRHE